MAEIKLTRGKVAIVDDDDFSYLNQWKWQCAKIGNVFYAVRDVRVDGVSIRIYMHRQILDCRDSQTLVDHINQDGLNNQKSNLRLATRSENNCNKPSRRNTSSKYKGVRFRKDRGKWTARIRKDNKTINLGVYISEELAALAYNEAAIKYHGEFAYLNKVTI